MMECFVLDFAQDRVHHHEKTDSWVEEVSPDSQVPEDCGTYRLVWRRPRILLASVQAQRLGQSCRAGRRQSWRVESKERAVGPTSPGSEKQTLAVRIHRYLGPGPAVRRRGCPLCCCSTFRAPGCGVREPPPPRSGKHRRTVNRRRMGRSTERAGASSMEDEIGRGRTAAQVLYTLHGSSWDGDVTGAIAGGCHRIRASAQHTLCESLVGSCHGEMAGPEAVLLRLGMTFLPDE